MFASAKQLCTVEAGCGLHRNAQEVSTELHLKMRASGIFDHFTRQGNRAPEAIHIIRNNHQKARDAGPNAPQFGATAELLEVQLRRAEEPGYVGHVAEPEIEMAVHALQG